MICEVDVLSPNSVKKLKQQLERYQKSLDEKTFKLVDRVTEEIERELKLNIAMVDFPDGNFKLTTSRREVAKSEFGYTGRVFYEGSEAVFIEFGAGFTYNGAEGTSLHPKGQELGFTVHSFNPESDNAINPDGWYYGGVKTFGIKAQAPLYNAFLQVVDEIPRIAKEVYRSN